MHSCIFCFSGYTYINIVQLIETTVEISDTKSYTCTLKSTQHYFNTVYMYC